MNSSPENTLDLMNLQKVIKNMGTQKLIDEFGNLFANSYPDINKKLAKICIEKQIEENKSILSMIHHLNERTILVLNDRIFQLQQQLKEI